MFRISVVRGNYVFGHLAFRRLSNGFASEELLVIYLLVVLSSGRLSVERCVPKQGNHYSSKSPMIASSSKAPLNWTLAFRFEWAILKCQRQTLGAHKRKLNFTSFQQITSHENLRVPNTIWGPVRIVPEQAGERFSAF